MDAVPFDRQEAVVAQGKGIDTGLLGPNWQQEGRVGNKRCQGSFEDPLLGLESCLKDQSPNKSHLGLFNPTSAFLCFQPLSPLLPAT